MFIFCSDLMNCQGSVAGTSTSRCFMGKTCSNSPFEEKNEKQINFLNRNWLFHFCSLKLPKNHVPLVQVEI